MKNDLKFTDFLKDVFSTFDKKVENSGLVSICVEIPCIDLFKVYELFINKPISKDVYAINEIIFLFFIRFTIEWNLNSSIPVSASNKSLVRFSQINIKIAATVNAIKL